MNHKTPAQIHSHCKALVLLWWNVICSFQNEATTVLCWCLVFGTCFVRKFQPATCHINIIRRQCKLTAVVIIIATHTFFTRLLNVFFMKAPGMPCNRRTKGENNSKKFLPLQELSSSLGLLFVFSLLVFCSSSLYPELSRLFSLFSFFSLAFASPLSPPLTFAPAFLFHLDGKHKKAILTQFHVIRTRTVRFIAIKCEKLVFCLFGDLIIFAVIQQTAQRSYN